MFKFIDDENDDGLGDICTSNKDYDNDGIDDGKDNCLIVYNPEQLDEDSDGLGNECDDDIDNDGIDNNNDNCRLVFNPLQEDTNGNGKGDRCETDEDGDGRVMRLRFLKKLLYTSFRLITEEI